MIGNEEPASLCRRVFAAFRPDAIKRVNQNPEKHPQQCFRQPAPELRHSGPPEFSHKSKRTWALPMTRTMTVFGVSCKDRGQTGCNWKCESDSLPCQGGNRPPRLNLTHS